MIKLHNEYLVVVEADDVAVSPVQAEPNLLHSQFGTELET